MPRVRARQLVAYAAERLGGGLQVGVADLAVQLDNLLQLGDGPAELPPSAVDHRHVIAGHRLPGPVPTSRRISSACPKYSSARCRSPRPSYTRPMLVSVTVSPARSPTSRVIGSDCP